MTSDPDCIFCKIIAGEIPCFKVYEDDATLAFMDINPVSDGHALIIPKTHAADLLAAPDEVVAATVRTAKKVAGAVQAELDPAGINLMQCNGPGAAQSVMHFHMHVIPRRMDDGLNMNWEIVPGDMAAIGVLAERLAGQL